LDLSPDGDHARYRRACRLPALHRDLFQLRGPAFRRGTASSVSQPVAGNRFVPGGVPVAAPGHALRERGRRDRTLLHHQPPHDSALDRARREHHTAGFRDGDKCVLLRKMQISSLRSCGSMLLQRVPSPASGRGCRANARRERAQRSTRRSPSPGFALTRSATLSRKRERGRPAGTREVAGRRFLPHQCSNPTIAPISSVASVPDRIDFMPSASTSARRSGAITERPPIMMPSEPKLAKPHIA
jgi:hypothetical protein